MRNCAYGSCMMADNQNKENEDPIESCPVKRLKLSLSKKKNQSRWHFLDSEEERMLGDVFQPKNTKESTKWAVKNFKEWSMARNTKNQGNPSEQVPDSVLESTEPVVLSRWLSLYLAETRKINGEPYPPKSLYALLCGVYRHMKSLNPLCPNIMDLNNPEFSVFHTALDNVFRDLRADGVGSSSKAAEVFTREEENELWSRGILGVNNPKALLRAVFFLNGKNFCLRGGQEHRGLKISQIKRELGPDRYIYTENLSKNRTGGLANMRVEHKVVPIYAIPEAKNRCHVFILDEYFRRLPLIAFEKDNFYLQPIDGAESKSPADAWFTSTPVGRNTLQKMVKDMCAECGLAGSKTNHSLRATGATELFNAGIPEKVIQKHTGHLSLSGLRHYERVTQQQEMSVSRVLSTASVAVQESYKDDAALDRNPIGDMEPEEKPPEEKPAVGPTVPQMTFTGCTVNIYQGNKP